MFINSSNFSAHIISNNDTSNVNTIFNKNKIRTIYGCNQAIKSYDESRLFIIIPNEKINNVCLRIRKTLNEIIDEFSLFGFSYTIHNPSIEKPYEFCDGYTYYLSNSTIFEINHTDQKERYYAFCMIRHLYYYQNILINYFSIHSSEDSIEEKVIKMSAAVESTGQATSIHTFIPYRINIPVSAKDLLNNFLKNGSNSYSSFSCNFYTSCSDLNSSNINKIYNSYKERFKSFLDRLDLRENFILVNRYYLNLIPREIIISYPSDFYIKELDYTDHYYVPINVKEEYLKYFERKNNDFLEYRLIEVIEPKKSSSTPVSYSLVYTDSNGNICRLSRANELNGKYFKFNLKGYESDIIFSRPEVFVDIRSRHPSHNIFRRRMKSRKKALIRLGSTTIATKKYDIEINNIESIRNSSNKYFMKTLFTDQGVATPEWTNNVELLLDDDPVFDFPIVAKNIYGSRGTGNYKINTKEELEQWISRRRGSLSNYIFEKFKNYAKEYRVHVSKNGAFLVWRKVRKLDTPDNQKWFFNNQNCNWLSEHHEMFDTPNNFDDIKRECVKALNAVGLDIGACDVRVSNNYDSKGRTRKALFSIIEINSAPSMGDATSAHYIDELTKLINS